MQWQDVGNYSMTFKQFTQSNASLDWLTEVFLKNYERAGVAALTERMIYFKKQLIFLKFTESF